MRNFRVYTMNFIRYFLQTINPQIIINNFQTQEETEKGIIQHEIVFFETENLVVKSVWATKILAGKMGQEVISFLGKLAKNTKDEKQIATISKTKAWVNKKAVWHPSLVISVVCLIRNILSYKNKLTKNLTYLLLIISVAIGLYANNLGGIGLMVILASAGYTVCIYLTKNEQQMRWAMVVNQLLWFIHNFYVQAYPSAVACIVLCIWTFIQIYKNHRQFIS